MTTIDEQALYARAQLMGEAITARSGLPDNIIGAHKHNQAENSQNRRRKHATEGAEFMAMRCLL